ncbi:hypothetical protein [Myceligenerans xiligouense]|uniref:Uncharacterized protein n=1 Tax=Myceligenerans xiligouense TaxID=253184 RepID=A0A3N4ZHK0_9MICO|nr:hypothetical protein [Myceligenerans xiligouense]RPF20345.1 hypothetical protein EDD34_0933 [Myceligenerans xiligouense]
MLSTGFTVFLAVGFLFGTLGLLGVQYVASQPSVLITVVLGVSGGVLSLSVALRLRIVPVQGGGVVVHHFPRGSDFVPPGAIVSLVPDSHDYLWFLSLWVPVIHEEERAHTLTAWGQYTFLGGRWFVGRRVQILQTWLREGG